MWILPKQLHTSPFVPDTEALISDLDEQSQLCAQSLTQRGKDSAARTWLAKLKRDSWMQHLYGRTLRPSHGPSFTAAWISSVAATRASHSAQPASDSAPKTPDTSGRIYQPELLSCDQQYVSLKTSKDISRWGCPTSSKTWQDWVTQRRGAYSARLKSARRIKEREFSSWPTTSARDAKGGYQNGRIRNGKVSMDTLDVAVQAHRETGLLGQAAPASSSSLGSRQGLWLTPRANESDSDPKFAARNADRGAHCHGTLSSQTKELWPTITAHTPDMESNGPNGHSGTYLAGAVKQWATPRSGKTTDENPETWALRQANGDVATMPLTAQVKCWATPRTPTGGPESAQRKQELGRKTSGGGDLASQASGKLNPRWVETLMGLPIGWTMPSCLRPVTIAPTSCDSSATESCRPPQSERSECLLASCGNWTTPNQVDATIEKGALRPSRIATGRKTDYLARQVQMQLK